MLLIVVACIVIIVRGHTDILLFTQVMTKVKTDLYAIILIIKARVGYWKHGFIKKKSELI